MTDEPRVAAWERRTDWPLIAAAVLFFAAYAAPILHPDLNDVWRRACSILSATVWVVFAVDYAVRLALARDRLGFVRSRWLDGLALVLPMLRPLRALRLVAVAVRVGRRSRVTWRGRTLTYVAGSMALLMVLAALAVLDAERGRDGGNITGFGDALWWAVTTVTTVGYGDRFPVTAEGRAVAIGLMVAGIALLGVITGALASWFVEHLSGVEEAEARAEATLEEVLAELHAIRAELSATTRTEHTPPV